MVPAADIVADVSLVAVPMQLWKDAGLSRSRKILILSAFGASLSITAITIPHSIMLFDPFTETTLIFAHVKVSMLPSSLSSASPNPHPMEIRPLSVL